MDSVLKLQQQPQPSGTLVQLVQQRVAKSTLAKSETAMAVSEHDGFGRG